MPPNNCWKIINCTADLEIRTLQAKITCLKQEKKVLIQQLLTGKRRVKIDKPEVAKWPKSTSPL